ncbi:MAG: methyltransferase [Acidimicrobiia bacterium]
MSSPESPSGPRRDTGSFRDPSGHVYFDGDRVIRVLDEHGREAWAALANSSLFGAFTTDRRLIGTHEIPLDDVGEAGWATALQHDRIPVISYPYEWSFRMLKDAALLTLDLLAAALEEDLVLKDATPFNVQFDGIQPTFIDIGSFETLQEGEAWTGYRQFCRMFLYPLMLRAYKEVSFRPWLRGSLDGIAAADFRQLLRPRDLLRKGVLLHVAMQARAERRYQAVSRDVRSEIRQAGFRKELIQNNVTQLQKIVGGLTAPTGGSEWSDYSSQDHVLRQRELKGEFLRRSIADPSIVWDLGANDGYFSRIAAESGAYVVAADSDEIVVDRLYQTLTAEGNQRIHPLVVDVAAPSPSTGWRQRERTALETRANPDLVVMYAVLHHIVIGGNVPVREVLEWLATLNTRVVIEFVPIGDPMTDLLLANKRESDVHPDYTEEAFRAHLASWFDIEDEEAVTGSTRTLFSLRPLS